MFISIVLPWRPGNPEREASKRYVVSQLLKSIRSIVDNEASYSGYELIEADDPGKEFNRGRALHAGVLKSKGDLLILCDSDLIIKEPELKEALDIAANNTEVSFVVPFNSVCYLDERSSNIVINSKLTFNMAPNLKLSSVFDRKSTGGCVVLSRDRYLAFDPRFAGWGFEDAGWAMAMETMHGPICWLETPCYHLYHRSAFNPKTPEYTQSVSLVGRYTAANGNPSQMQLILDEFKESFYCIKPGYKCNEPKFFDDTNFENDMYQKKVYERALHIMQAKGYKTILDVGCGSGYKLMNMLGKYDTVGADVGTTLEFLQNKYPTRKWMSAEEPWEEGVYDLVICADVIEHLSDPDLLLTRLRKTKCKYILLSTPDRDIVRGPETFGPPTNPYHVREWNQAELKQYIEKFMKVKSIEICSQWEGCILVTIERNLA